MNTKALLILVILTLNCIISIKLKKKEQLGPVAKVIGAGLIAGGLYAMYKNHKSKQTAQSPYGNGGSTGLLGNAGGLMGGII
jgi:hypothetical protein